MSSWWELGTPGDKNFQRFATFAECAKVAEKTGEMPRYYGIDFYETEMVGGKLRLKEPTEEKLCWDFSKRALRTWWRQLWQSKKGANRGRKK